MICSLLNIKDLLVDRFGHLQEEKLIVIARGWYVEDGDTIITARFVGGFRGEFSSARVIGVDTPENHTSDDYHRAVGNMVRDCVHRWMDRIEPSKLRIEEVGTDKYSGRYLAKIYDIDHPIDDLASYILKSGLAMPYMGETKQVWTREKLQAVALKAGAELAKPYKPRPIAKEWQKPFEELAKLMAG